MKLRTTIHIEEEVIKKAKHMAVERGISVSELIEELIKKEK